LTFTGLYSVISKKRELFMELKKLVFALCMTQTQTNAVHASKEADRQYGRHVDDPYSSLLCSSLLRINVWLYVYYNFCTVCIPSAMHHWVFPKQVPL
jgi:hypothetical protein